MLRNYLKIAFRHLFRKKGYTIINITGLSVGIACCISILLYVQEEMTYDTFHEHSERIYRVQRTHMGSGEQEIKTAASNYALAPVIENNFPQVEEIVRISEQEEKISFEDRVFIEPHFYFSDPNIFDLFTIKILAGNKETALRDPFSVVITKKTAQKYFGTQNPIGKQLTLTRDKDYSFTVTAVVEEFPENSHFKFDFLATLESTKNWYNEIMYTQWGNMWLHTYLLLNEGTDVASFEEQLNPVVLQFAPPAVERFKVQFSLMPLEDIHLYSNTGSELEPGGSAVFIYVFIAVAVVVLAIACFNFINLSTARSSWRAKEVGMRKVLGAHKWNLVKQFIGESFLVSLISLVLAIILVELVLPFLNTFTGIPLELNILENSYMLFGLFMILVTVGFLAGSYPAFVLSSFKPVKVLKGDTTTGSQNMTASLRKSLVVFQFSLSTILIIGTIVIFSQLDHIKQQDLGFSKDQVVIVNVNNRTAGERIDLLKENIRNAANVLEISAASDAIPKGLNSWRVRKADEPEGSFELLKVMAVDHNFFELMDVPVLSGRNFSPDRSTDVSNAVILNESAVRHFGFQENPIGKKLHFYDQEKEVVGVVRDFHTNSLYEEIIPVSFHLYPDWFDQLYVKISSEDIPGTIANLEKQWSAISSDWPFEYHFMDDAFARLYEKEEKLGKLIGIFSMLTIFVACLGLFGLASFTTEQRFKEIGIRKVLGATIPNILSLLSRDYFVLIILSFVISVPVSLWLLNEWLTSFTTHISLNLSYFMLGGAIVVLIAIATVSYQSLKAATMNPVDSLKNE